MAKLYVPNIDSLKGDPRLLQGRSNQRSGSPVLAANETGIPQPVTNPQATSTRVSHGGATYAKVVITHKISSSDSAFHHANVWITGLGGSATPQLQSGSTSTPHVLLLPATGERVTTTIQSVGKDGSLLPMSQSPSTSVSL